MEPPVTRSRRRPWPVAVWAAGFTAALALAYAADLTGRLPELTDDPLAVLTGDPAGLAARFLLALAAATLLVGFVALGRLMSFRGQVGFVWLGLLVLLLVFFYGFDLKLSVIGAKFPYLAGLRLHQSGFLQGAALTLFLCSISIACSTVIGLVAGLCRLSSNPVAFGTATFYISFFRGTPLLVQVLLIYLGLPQIGLVISAIPAGIIALSLNYGAYLAEIFRAGIASIGHGQREAARALGLRPSIIMRKIILPQAMRVIVPPTGSQFIAMLKDSSLVSLMGVWEIMFLARAYGRAEYRYIEMLLTAAALYWIMSIGFELVQARLERYYGKGFRR